MQNHSARENEKIVRMLFDDGHGDWQVQRLVIVQHDSAKATMRLSASARAASIQLASASKLK
ncbi:MAG: hypothetical protein H7335_17695 [Massilia sp.]|nr:hypothetical protein [Massilia sp.]